MGIPLLLRALRNKFGDTFLTSTGSEIEILLVDCNSLIHESLTQFKDNNKPVKRNIEAFELFADSLLSLCQKFNPKKLALMVDGPVPMAKIQQQKERRYEAAMSHTNDTYSSAMITPGTSFMVELDEYIKDNIFHKKDYYGLQEIIYSSHTEQGEGEHKIMDVLRNGSYKSAIIYGSDSDLILLGLTLNINALYICRKNVKLISRKMELIMKEDVQDAVNVVKLKRLIVNKLGNKNKLNDLIFLASLLGNDFIPKLYLFADIVTSFSFLIDYLAKYEHTDDKMKLLGDLLVDLAITVSNKCNFKSLVQRYEEKEFNDGYRMFDSTTFNAIVSSGEEISEKRFRTYWYTKMNIVSALDVYAICCDYIRGLFWVYQYYTEGQDMVTWTWNYKYLHSPHVADLAILITKEKSVVFKNAQKVGPYKGEVRFTPLHQLVAVMPRQYIEFVPKQLHFLYTMSSPLVHLMPNTILIDNEFTQRSYQKKVVIPQANYLDIVNVLSQVKMDSILVNSMLNTKTIVNSAKISGKSAPTLTLKPTYRKLKK